MDEVESGQPAPTPVEPARPGDRLRAARDSRGLSLAEIAARTRVPQRHLEALEAGDYGALPSPTYAMGFAKAYARAVGMDEVELAADLRRELDRMGPRQPEYVPYETADPARVPSRGVAVLGVGIALAVLILVGLWYGTNLFQQHGATPPAAQDAVVAQAVTPRPTAAATPAAPTGGQVVLTAKDEVWLRVYDADNKTLYLGTMKPGETFAVPATANDPKINVGRPDKLDVTLNGTAIPPLGDGSRAIKDVRVSGAAIAARLSGAPAPTATPSAAATSTTRSSEERSPRRSERRADRPATSETQRANLQSAETAPTPPPATTGNSSAP
jgi:cytoskeleton protein RodZ